MAECAHADVLADNGLRENARGIIKTFGLTDNELVFNHIIYLLYVSRRYNVPVNTALWDDNLLNHKLFPRGEKISAMLAASWKRPASRDFLATISSQSAGIVQSMRKGYGFVFVEYKPECYEGRGEYYDFSTGMTRYGYYRHILRIDRLLRLVRVDAYVKCTKAERSAFVRARTDPFTGIGSKLQIDHRRPVSACDKLGISPAVLTSQSLVDTIDGRTVADLNFQCLTASSNTHKREVCSKCLRGGTIELPDGLGVLRLCYRQSWDDPRCAHLEKCVGCWLFDPTRPAFPLPEVGKIWTL